MNKIIPQTKQKRNFFSCFEKLNSNTPDVFYYEVRAIKGRVLRTVHPPKMPSRYSNNRKKKQQRKKMRKQKKRRLDLIKYMYRILWQDGTFVRTYTNKLELSKTITRLQTNHSNYYKKKYTVKRYFKEL
jgi:hypothetical protein